MSTILKGESHTLRLGLVGRFEDLDLSNGQRALLRQQSDFSA
jgi:hypothetical protein